MAGPCGDHMRPGGVPEEPGLGALAPGSDQGRLASLCCPSSKGRPPRCVPRCEHAVLLASAGVTMAPCFQPLSLRFWVVLKLKGLSACKTIQLLAK